MSQSSTSAQKRSLARGQAGLDRSPDRPLDKSDRPADKPEKPEKDVRAIPPPRTPRGQHTRQLLLQAAEEVFGERGFDRASISEITQRAGVAQGTFYVYFVDKKAIFLELVRSLNDRLRDVVLAAMDGVTDPVEVERVRFQTFFRFVMAHRNLYRIVRQAEWVDEETFKWYYRRLAEGYGATLARAMESGALRPMGPEFVAYCLMGMADFVGMRYCLWADEGPSDDDFENLITIITRGLCAAPAPRTPALQEP